MKTTRLFLVLILFILALLCLTACDLSFIGGLMTPTTAPTTTTSPTTTTEPTTTAPVTTTVPVTTTAPIEISQNPIKSVSLTTDGTKLIIKYQNNNNQTLVTEISPREGYNGATFVGFDFNTENRVLTLSFQENAARNRAEIILGNSDATPKIFYVREMGGKLQYTEDLVSPNWVEFAPSGRVASVGGVPILTSLLDKAEYGKIESAPLGSGTVLTIKQEEAGKEEENAYFPGKKKGAYIRVRATEWQKEGFDFVNDMRRFGSRNWAMILLQSNEVDSSVPYEDVKTSTFFKLGGDDITPFGINGDHMGGNHGYGVISAIPNTTGLTEKDIGSVWALGSYKYVLVKVYANSDTGGEEMAWFCPLDDQMMQTGIFKRRTITEGSTLTHVSGATHTASITATKKSVGCQFQCAINHLEQHVFLNGTTEIDLDADGIYEADFIDFHEKYDIVYLPTVLTYLMENVGNNTNFSHFDESIEDSYITFDITYRFHKNGACVLYSDYTFNQDMTSQSIGGIQSYPWAGNVTEDYLYIPGTIKYKSPTLHKKGDQVQYGWEVEDLENPNSPTISYFQLSDAIGTKAMNLGYYPLYGDARPERRLALADREFPFGYSEKTLKMYPSLFRQNNALIEAGTTLSFISYRVPSVPTHEDMLAVNWYWVGDEIVLSLHTQKVLSGKAIALPDYMNGMTVSVIEKSNSATVETTTVENGTITLSTNDVGYAIVKLSPAK